MVKIQNFNFGITGTFLHFKLFICKYRHYLRATISASFIASCKLIG